MRRGLWILFVASIALNVGFVSAAIVHWSDLHRAPPPPAIAPGPLHRPGQRPMGLMRQWPQRRVDRLSKALDLTPEQEAQLRASLEELREAIRARNEDLMRERTIMRQALLEEDRELVHRQARAVNMLQAQLDSLVAEAMLREGAIFTPEQRRKIHEMEWGPEIEGPGRMDERSERP
jgi:Spy/CpxP family protein refolding chaperone